MVDQQFPQSIGLYISQITEKKLLSEITIPQAKQTCIYLFEFSNINSRINCNICSKLTKEAPGVVLVSLLLILNIFDTA